MSTNARTTIRSTNAADPSAPTPRARRAYTILLGLSALFVFLQSVTSAEFISDATPKAQQDIWVDVHGAVADAAWGFAVIAAIVALVALRRAWPRQTTWTVVFALAAMAQTGIGHLITDFGMDWLVLVHVPLAFVVYGLVIWLSVQVARSNRALRG